MRVLKVSLAACLLSLAVLPGAQADTLHAAVPFPSKETPKPVDLGALTAQTPISVTVALALPDLEAAERLLVSLTTAGDPQYHQFLTAQQFEARFAPAKSEVSRVTAALEKFGLTVEPATATTLRVTGLPAALERAFAVTLHNYEVPAHGTSPGYRFHAPVSHSTVPSEIASSVSAVIGLDSRASMHPLNMRAPMKQANNAKPNPKPAGSSTLNPFGSLTVTDFAKLYDVQPLYKRGVTGHGRTIGIMSLAGFTPSDVFAYWNALGLEVSPKRLTVVDIDGGPGAPSDVSGSLETTLDIEQSGGIAPGANIIAYLAPNTNQGFIDLFAAAIEANKAETLSISWGDWEWFSTIENAPVSDPYTGKTVSSLQAVHELLVRAALQGQSVYTSAGDGGAYEVNDDLGCYGPYSRSQPLSCSRTLSLDYPASDTAITAAGGTTLPGLQEYCLNAACTAPYYDVTIPHERVWGWDYLLGFCKAIGTPSPVDCGIFPAGGGGGVSVFFLLPWYQWFTPGVQLSQPGQVYRAGAEIGQEDEVGTYFALPGFFPGRNVPDVSFNADPETGYVVFYTSDVSGYAEQTYWGGTSFVAPQLNGVTALYGEYVHSRLGLLNPEFYAAAYARRQAPLHPIAYGDNWFYYGRNGYSPAAGLGTLDVADFAQFLANPF